MMSVGSISAPSRSNVVLFDYEFLDNGAFLLADFLQDGNVQFYAGFSYTIPGMWWTGPTTSNIGGQFEFRITKEAGDTVGVNIGTFGTWRTGYHALYFDSGTYGKGRVLVEIRDRATSTIRASARFWRGSQYAP